jgi:hypothetical protein
MNRRYYLRRIRVAESLKKINCDAYILLADECNHNHVRNFEMIFGIILLLFYIYFKI